MAHDVFISHSSKDKAVADATCAGLEQRGIHCWIAPRDIIPGANWGGSIVKAIHSARVMILIFSRHTNASPQIKREVERAVNAGVAIIPVRIDDVLPQDDLEYFLGTPHWLDAFNSPLESHLDALGNAVHQILELPASESSETSPEMAAVDMPTVTEAAPESVPMSDPLPPAAPKKSALPFVLTGIVFLLGVAAIGWYFLAGQHKGGTAQSSAPAKPSENVPTTASANATPNASQIGPETPQPELNRLAEAGDARAQSEMGRRYRTGIKVSIDYNLALSWSQKAAAQGDAQGFYNVGVAYLQGHGVVKDYQQALNNFQKAADQGDPNAEYDLGSMYHFGWGVPQDEQLANSWYQKAIAGYQKQADQGRTGGEIRLGEIYKTGVGAPQDFSKALSMLRKAADQGDGVAESDLAFMYADGDGVPKDNREALSWFEKAARQGDAAAEFNVGFIYVRGDGVPQNNQLAMDWFRRAADQGHVRAAYEIGRLYYTGAGVAQDYRAALSWCLQAANGGYAPAENIVGSMYEKGQGVPANKPAAITWYQKAAGHGYTPARQNLVRLGAAQ